MPILIEPPPLMKYRPHGFPSDDTIFVCSNRWHFFSLPGPSWPRTNWFEFYRRSLCAMERVETLRDWNTSILSRRTSLTLYLNRFSVSKRIRDVVAMGETGLLMRGMIFFSWKLTCVLRGWKHEESEKIRKQKNSSRGWGRRRPKIQFPIFDYIGLCLNLARDGTHTYLHYLSAHTWGMRGFSGDYGMMSKHLLIRYYFDKCEIPDKCLLSTIYNRNSKW